MYLHKPEALSLFKHDNLNSVINNVYRGACLSPKTNLEHRKVTAERMRQKSEPQLKP